MFKYFTCCTKKSATTAVPTEKRNRKIIIIKAPQEVGRDPLEVDANIRDSLKEAHLLRDEDDNYPSHRF